MNIELKDDLAEFIEREVQAGHYPSAEEAVNAAVARLQVEEEAAAGDDLSDVDVRAIETGLAELSRGEGIPWPVVRERLKRRIHNV